jgi:hypothetical protein
MLVVGMPKPAAQKYRTTNWTAYNAALKQQGSLAVVEKIIHGAAMNVDLSPLRYEISPSRKPSSLRSAHPSPQF